MTHLLRHAFVTARFSMAIRGCGSDPAGRQLVLSVRAPGRPDAAPPDCLVLDPQGALVHRFRSGAEVDEVFGALSLALDRAPSLDPRPLPPEVADPMTQRYAEGLEMLRGGEVKGAWELWDEIVASAPTHPLRYRIDWHRLPPVFLPEHPDMHGVPVPRMPAPVTPPDPARRAQEIARMRADPEVRWSPAGLPFVRVPAGRFTMGGSPAQKAEELPRREVTLSRGYWLGAWPLTRAVWHRYVSGPVPAGLEGEVPYGGATIDQVNALCARMGQEDGWRYRLPTEAEWERAARGGLEGATYPWGDAEIDPTRCNYASPSPLPVACYPPNAYGLFDMVGNSPEWTSDYHRADAYALTSAVVTDPEGPPRDDACHPITRVVRGGACQRPFMALFCRNSRRLAAPETPPPWMQISVRLVADPPPGLVG